MSSPLHDVIESYSINYHLYADDSQLYVAFKTNDGLKAVLVIFVVE